MELELKSLVSNKSGYQNSKTLVRDGGLQIDYDGSKFSFLGLGTMFPPDRGAFKGQLDVSSQKLAGKIFQCRNAWTSVTNCEINSKDAQSVVVKKLPFMDKLDLGQFGQEQRNTWMGQLATAGDMLFKALFDGDAGLKKIGDILSRESRARQIILSITSQECFVPWQMLYVHPDGELEPDGGNWSIEGFWGYKHLIEHNTENVRCSTSVISNLDAAFCVDDRIKHSWTEFSSCTDHFASLNLKFDQVNQKPSLMQAVTSSTKDLYYFYCHGKGGDTPRGISSSPIQLALADDIAISPDEISYWAERNQSFNPVIFINACQGGQIGSGFFQSFVEQFLSRGALCVIGPQIDVPSNFAASFAHEVFKEFISGADRLTLGQSLQKVTKQFWDEKSNPLGFIYSLYRGIDIALRRPE